MIKHNNYSYKVKTRYLVSVLLLLLIIMNGCKNKSGKYDLQTGTWITIKLEKFGLSRVYSLSNSEIEEFKNNLNNIEKVNVKIPEKQTFEYRIKIEKLLVDKKDIEYWELYKINNDIYIKDPQNNILRLKIDMVQFLNNVYEN